MKIVIDTEERMFLDKGEVATLQSCLAHVAELRPDADVAVAVDVPLRLRYYAPAAAPLVRTPGGVRRPMPGMTRLRRAVPRPLLAAWLDACGPRIHRRHTGWTPGRDALAAVRDADLLLVLGGSRLGGTEPAETRRLLALLDAGIEAGIPTVLVADDVGPPASDELRRAAAATLPGLALVTVPDPGPAVAAVAALGAPDERIVVAGNPALGLAGLEPPIPRGRALGVALHGSVDEAALASIGAAIRAAASDYDAPLVEIVNHPAAVGRRGPTRTATEGHPEVIREQRRSRPPAAIARRIAGCRAVVTDDPGVARLALARGVPAVGLACDASAERFERLRAGHPGALNVVPAKGPDLEAALRGTIDRTWATAPGWREQLLAAARDELAAQRSLYRRVLTLAPGARGPAEDALAPTEPARPLALSVVIPAHNAGTTLESAIRGLATTGWDQPWEIVVADNGSTDDTRNVVAALRETMPFVRLVDAGDRPGAAHARNVGAREARGRSVAFFDADDVPHDGWIAAMGGALATSDFVACRLETEALNDERAQAMRGRPQSDGLVPTIHYPYLPIASGGTIGIRRSVFIDVGGFDETLPLAGEDVEFCWRVQLAGYPLEFVPDAVVSMKFRTTRRAVFGQARRYGYGQPAVYERYRFVAPPDGPPPAPTEAPEGSRLRPSRVATRLAELGTSDGRARWVWRCGWYTGVVQGRLRRHADGLLG